MVKLSQQMELEGKKWKRMVIYSMCFAHCTCPSIMGHKVFPVHALVTTMEIRGGRGA